MKHDLASNLRFFRTVTKVKNINNYKSIFYFKHMGSFMICQGMWGLRNHAIWVTERGVIGSRWPGLFSWLLFLLELLFTQKPTNSTLTICYCICECFPLLFHSLVCTENNLFIVGIGPILNKELKFIFRSDNSDRTVAYS